MLAWLLVNFLWVFSLLSYLLLQALLNVMLLSKQPLEIRQSL